MINIKKNNSNADIKKVQLKLLPLNQLEKLLDSVISLFPRKLIDINLRPLGDIEVVDSEYYRYRSTGSDPRFEIHFDTTVKQGWYYLEAALTRPNGDRVAKIYLDLGKGFSENSSIFIPSNLRGSIREVFYLPIGVKALRWDPLESIGSFNQSHIVIHKITLIESFFRRAWRVCFDLYRLRHKPISSKEGLTTLGALKSLSTAYSQSANLRRGGHLHEGDYTEWIRRYDILDESKRTRILERVNAMTHQPLISIVMPCYNPNSKWLKEAIDSVRLQLYPHWELCIADDASTDANTVQILQNYSEIDSRIKLVFREHNDHICAASNSALEIATGEYIALLDQDDIIPEHALFWVADTIIKNPKAGIIYSDEDKIDEKGQRSGPYFKCDFNYDLFLSHNLICHFGVYRRNLVESIGGFKKGFEGSQDWDLALRCYEHLKPNEIVHIPRILYHWRMHEESTAKKGQEAKPYAYIAAENALNSHFKRNKIKAHTALISTIGAFRTHYSLPKTLPLVTLIIPTHNSVDILQQCVTSILEKTDYANYEILIIDNGSDELETLEYFHKIKNNSKIRVMQDDGPFNYSAINNKAVTHARGKYIGLINNDIEVINSEWLSEMLSIAMQSGVGAVGARLWYPNDTLQHGGVITGLGGLAAHSHRLYSKGSLGYAGRLALIQSLSAVTAACLVVSKAIYEKIGGLNEESLKVAYNDVDFCLRLGEAGYRNVWTPFADLYHHESFSRGQEDTPEKQERFLREKGYMVKRWGDVLMNDPAYSPNLTLDREDFSYAWPPRVESV
jgi:glycosyltransferase involved in cell wall biosynthesis